MNDTYILHHSIHNEYVLRVPMGTILGAGNTAKKHKTECMRWGTSLGKPHSEVIFEQDLKEVKQ